MLRKPGIAIAALCITAAFGIAGCSDDDSGSECGDGVISGSEVCDDLALGGATCADEGFTGGVLTCNATCSGVDTSQCTNDVCGDGEVTGMEDCDGANLDMTTCEDLNYDGGSLACNNCSFDESGCYDNCGDDTIQAGDEICDGADLAMETCVTQGYDAGTLACAGDCSAFDTMGCCDDNCTMAGDTQCTSDTLNTCTLGANGCLDWVDTDCTATSEVCSGTPAACAPSCTSDCPAIDDTQCTDATNLETCTDSGNGCMNWVASPCTGGWCGADPAMCFTGGTGNACNDVYNLTGRTFPHTIVGDWATGAYTFQGSCMDGGNPIYTSYTVQAASPTEIIIEVQNSPGVYNYPEITAYTSTEATGFCDGAQMTEIGCSTGSSTYQYLVLDASGITTGDTIYTLLGGDGVSYQLIDPEVWISEVVCGDASVLGSEVCDDGNTTAGDGCDANCRPELGWSCDGSEPSVCIQTCSNGTVDSTGMEQCDDGNLTNGDGCDDSCQVQAGYICVGEPSTCSTATQADYPQTGLALAIPDNGYDGTLGSMACVDFVVPSTATNTVLSAQLQVAMDHTWVGDLTIKVISPASTVTTILSRPGYTETVDDGTGCCGNSSNMTVASPITYRDSSANDAEGMGGTLGSSENICADDGFCDFMPNHGIATGTNGFADFATETAVGTWQVCIGDSVGGDTGTIDSLTLSLFTN